MIVCELDFVYICNRKKFLNREDAIRYIELERFKVNERQLDEESRTCFVKETVE